MPFKLPFNSPFFYNNYRPNYPSIPTSSNKPYSSNYFTQNTAFNPSTSIELNNISNEKKSSENTESSEPFFEILGIKLYFDDIIIICILFFLYNEKVNDEGLFICLILLLLS